MRRLLPVVLGLCIATHANANDFRVPKAKRNLVEDKNLLAAQQISRGVATIAKRAHKAIVFLSVYKAIKGKPFGMIDPFEYFFDQDKNPSPKQAPGKREGGLGSGYFIDLKRGLILTNNHVVQDADEIHLKLANGETYPGRIIGRDTNTDIAVVQIADDDFKRKGLATLSFADSDTLEVGDFVLALGAPYGLEASLSFGIVSALGRGNLDITRFGNFIQTDAAINPGNSGGPLLNMNGHLVGMNTAIYSRTGSYNGIGFAVPANLVAPIAEQLINQGYVQRGYLGVGLQPLDDELAKGLDLDEDAGGAVVSQVAPGSPAEKAGLLAGDVISGIEDKNIGRSDDIVTKIGLMKPGTKVRLQLHREGKSKTVSVTLEAHPEDKKNVPPPTRQNSKSQLPFGMQFESPTAAQRKQYKLESDQGVLVTQVEKNGPAERSGLRVGDLILKTDGTQITSKEALQKKIAGKSRALIWIERAGEFYFLTLRTSP